ncbi:Putative zinc-finger [Chitinophaga costaii]|uniref:Putative zinc-finger n=1 Tax=Chitinophaga costaii TaxID=1335309 RepID=A0A1C3YT18_9BACT|nr:HEAT repeat domain-containing protein [Chitinophaga costaii]PUZ30095.1 hypothetical protein DCM91_01055 [Chitinophaga costaii]SCB73241.1 Putative zinc-finger [Chitinophaga costaii]
MSCKESENLVHWLNNELKPDARMALEKHLAGCASCRQELAVTQQLWLELAAAPVPEPSDGIEKRFNAMMDGLTVEQEKRPFRESIAHALAGIFNNISRWQLGLHVVFLLLGAVLAWLVFDRNEHKSSQQDQIAFLSSEVNESRQIAVLSLLQNASATRRIQGVGYADKMENINGELIDALVNTLNNDPSVSVRLMTLETLARFTADAKVRTALVESINYQQSPLLLAAIADVMVRLKEKTSRDELKKMLEKKDLDTVVRQKLQQSIFKLT